MARWCRRDASTPGTQATTLRVDGSQGAAARAAVVVEVARGQPATDARLGPARAGASGDLGEPAATGAEEELRGHRVRDRRAVVVDVAVGLGQVEAAVVVGVEEGGAEAEHVA